MDVLHIDDLTEQLEAGFQTLLAEGEPAMHIDLHLPESSAYDWVGVDGEHRLVHLPTGVTILPASVTIAGSHNGGPAASFTLVARAEPDHEAIVDVAEDLMQRAVQWGALHYGTAPPEEAPPLPADLDDIVERALAGRAS